MANRFLSDRVNNLMPSGIRKFFEIAATMEEVISLGIGEPDFDSPGPVLEAGMRALKENQTHYTSNRGLISFGASSIACANWDSASSNFPWRA